VTSGFSWQLQESELPRIFDQLGVNFNDRILPSVVNEVLKSIVAKYDAEVKRKGGG
jgi:prohibitin 1